MTKVFTKKVWQEKIIKLDLKTTESWEYFKIVCMFFYWENVNDVVAGAPEEKDLNENKKKKTTSLLYIEVGRNTIVPVYASSWANMSADTNH